MPFLSWEIATREPAPGMPERVVTDRPPLAGDRFPPEVGLLLPAKREDKALLDRLSDLPEPGVAAVGLFMADPFLNVARAAARLTEAGVGWVANFPSVDQQDPDFAQHLGDVGLDPARETDVLAALSGRGLSTLAVVCDPARAAALGAASPRAVLALPRVADFAAGMPSMRHRGALSDAIGAALRQTGWSGTVLTLGTRGEADSPAIWHDAVDGLLLRPSAG